MSEFKALADRPLVLKNETCAYCSKPFDEDLKPTREHVIGRNFVPKVEFGNRFNLILRACAACNNEKSDLEDDIAVISMLPDQFGRYAVEDVRLREEVLRKIARARSRLTGRPVSDSTEILPFIFNRGILNIQASFSAPPQVERRRLYLLAHFHFRAFFYNLSYESQNRRGGFVLGGFYPLTAVHKSDWGASRPRWFMDITREWPLAFSCIAAEGYFKVLIRRNPHNRSAFSWALEWNGSTRVVGFAGNDEIIEAILASAPSEPMRILQETEKEVTRIREEVALPIELDDLFEPHGRRQQVE